MFICGDFLSGAYVPRQGFNIADKDSRTVFSLRMASCNTQHEQRQPRSLNVPEILANVLQHVDSKTLLAAAQVNSLWADEATNWLWRGFYRGGSGSLTAPLQGLSRCSHQRQGWYTSKVRYLDIEIDVNPHEPASIFQLLKAKIFTFPNARSVIVDLGSENMKEKDMAQFLSRNLVGLELFGGYYSRWFLEQVKMQAPSLRYFLLDNRLLDEEETAKFLTSIDFANFLESVPSITHLELLIGWRSVIDEGILHRIMLRPNLEMLSLGQDIPLRWETIARIANEFPQTPLFPALRYLDIAAEEKVLRFLLPKLVNLQGVSLNQIDPSLRPGDHVLGTLSSCSRMEDIVFESDHTTVITSNTFLKLAANCPELRKFELGDTCQCDHSFTDGLLETLASQWKYLTTLNFPFAAKLSIVSLVSLARHCPRLYDVKLMADLELHDLAHESTDITFPCLDALELGHITTSMLQSDRDAIKCRDQISWLLDDRFPLLYTFRFTLRIDNEHGRLLQRAMNHHLRTTRSTAVDLRPTPVFSKLIRRLIEPIAGSRYNPTF